MKYRFSEGATDIRDAAGELDEYLEGAHADFAKAVNKLLNKHRQVDPADAQSANVAYRNLQKSVQAIYDAVSGGASAAKFGEKEDAVYAQRERNTLYRLMKELKGVVKANLAYITKKSKQLGLDSVSSYLKNAEQYFADLQRWTRKMMEDSYKNRYGKKPLSSSLVRDASRRAARMAGDEDPRLEEIDDQLEIVIPKLAQKARELMAGLKSVEKLFAELNSLAGPAAFPLHGLDREGVKDLIRNMLVVSSALNEA